MVLNSNHLSLTPQRRDEHPQQYSTVARPSLNPGPHYTTINPLDLALVLGFVALALDPDGLGLVCNQSNKAFIASALQTFEKTGSEKCKEVSLEIALLGGAGPDINDAAARYQLTSLPRNFTGLHLVAVMYTAFRQVEPELGVGAGADFSVEYEAALKLHGKQLPTPVQEPGPGWQQGHPYLL